MTWKYNGKKISESEIYDIVYNNYTTDEYDELLDEVHGLIEIGNLSYNASHVLKMVDKIAYNIGFNEECDYMASEIITAYEDTDSYGFGIEYIDDEE